MRISFHSNICCSCTEYGERRTGVAKPLRAIPPTTDADISRDSADSGHPYSGTTPYSPIRTPYRVINVFYPRLVSGQWLAVSQPGSQPCTRLSFQNKTISNWSVLSLYCQHARPTLRGYQGHGTNSRVTSRDENDSGRFQLRHQASLPKPSQQRE